MVTYGSNDPKLAQLVGHRRLFTLLLVFDSFQPDKLVAETRSMISSFFGRLVLQNYVYIWFTCYVNKICVKLAQTKMYGLNGERFHVCKLERAQRAWRRLCQN